MNATQAIEKFVSARRVVRWLAEKDALDNIRKFYQCKQMARFLDLGCGTRVQGFRHEHEEHFAPDNIECMVKYGWINPVGVDNVPQATVPVGWTFIQGVFATQSTWDRIGTGYDVINMEFVISFESTRHISPSLLTPEINPYFLAKMYNDALNPLQYGHYFELVNSLSMSRCTA